MIVVYKRKFREKLYTAVVGNIVKMDNDKAARQIKAGIVEQYFGIYPPPGKMKIELKKLIYGKNDG